MESVALHTTCTILLVIAIMKLDSPRVVISRMVLPQGRIQDTRMRRMAFGLVRNRTVQAAEANCEITVAIAAP